MQGTQAVVVAFPDTFTSLEAVMAILTLTLSRGCEFKVPTGKTVKLGRKLKAWIASHLGHVL